MLVYRYCEGEYIMSELEIKIFLGKWRMADKKDYMVISDVPESWRMQIILRGPEQCVTIVVD